MKSANNTFLTLTVLLTGHFMLNTNEVRGSFLDCDTGDHFQASFFPTTSSEKELIESEESKRQKIHLEINKKYGALWDEETKQRIHNQTLQFFANCPEVSTKAIEYPLKVFSTCSPKEAQELITITQSLSMAAQDEDSFSQAFLLENIAYTESVKRTAAYLPLLKIAQHFEEGGTYTYLEDGFYQLYNDFVVKLDPSQYEWMADQVIRFGASERNVNKLNIYKGKKAIWAFKDMPSETQPLFSAFLEVNQVTKLKWIQQLAQVPPQDWVATLQGLRNQGGLGHQPVIAVNNQTAHDKQVEQDISTALTKLKKRYGEKPLENVVSLFKGKIKGALDQHLLSDQEHQIALLCLNKIGSEMQKHLSLIYQALEEKSLNLSAQDLHERWASWTKSALVDSQLAYWKDRGMQGIPPQDQWSKFESCFGGSANRLIFALNLLHEDVVIKEGQKILENVEKYKQDRAYGRLSIYGQEKLSQDLTAYQKDHPQASTQELKAYLFSQFHKALGEDNQAYLEMPKFQELIQAFLETLDLS